MEPRRPDQKKKERKKGYSASKNFKQHRQDPTATKSTKTQDVNAIVQYVVNDIILKDDVITKLSTKIEPQ